MIGIVILNYKTQKDVITCCESLKQLSMPHKVYIVDNDSKDGSFEFLSQYFQNNEKYEVLKSNRNNGYSAGNNIGVRQALAEKCSEILILNPDIIIIDNAVECMYNNLYSEEKIAVVGPTVFFPDGNVQNFCTNGITLEKFLIARVPYLLFDFKKLSYKAHLKFGADERVLFEGMVCGCCFMIKSSVMKEMGLFDENVFLYCEEDILACKLKNKNHLTLNEPSAKVIHRHSASIGSVQSPFSRLNRDLSAVYVLRAYRGIKGLKFLWVKFVARLNFLAFNVKFHYGLQELGALSRGLKKISKIEANSGYCVFYNSSTDKSL